MNLFDTPPPSPKRSYNQFELDTERELAAAFHRYPRSRPDPREVPFYPYFHHVRSPSPPTVTFSLGYNPFAVHTQ